MFVPDFQQEHFYQHNCVRDFEAIIWHFFKILSRLLMLQRSKSIILSSSISLPLLFHLKGPEHYSIQPNVWVIDHVFDIMGCHFYMLYSFHGCQFLLVCLFLVPFKNSLTFSEVLIHSKAKITYGNNWIFLCSQVMLKCDMGNFHQIMSGNSDFKPC